MRTARGHHLYSQRRLTRSVCNDCLRGGVEAPNLLYELVFLQTSRSLHQRPLRRQQLSSVENSDSEAFALSQGDHSPSSTPSREHHAKQKGDSFFLFTTRMVQQYMHEEELRAQHQATLLQLREKAIREKAQAELEWLRIKKEKLERKGAIEMISALMEKEKKVLKQLKLEQVCLYLVSSCTCNKHTHTHTHLSSPIQICMCSFDTGTHIPLT